jgi:hypothetical protein
LSTASSNNIKRYETALGHSFFFSDINLLYIRLNHDPEMTLPVVQRNFEQNYQQLGDIVVDVLLDTRHVDFIKFPRDVMEYMSDNPYNKYQKTNALLIRGLSQRILGNFYLNISRPKVKTRLFTGVKEALEWQNIQDAGSFEKIIENFT